VGSVVLDELAVCDKSLLANVTLMRFISTVTFLVELQGVFSGKFFATLFALMRLYTVMDRLDVMLEIIGL
jgi:hypothetical protein